MSTILPEKELPAELAPEQAVEQAYARELAEVASKLNRGLPTLIECDKDLAPFVFLNLRTRLREFNMRCRYLDGRPRENEPQGPVPVGLMGTMINQLRDAVRGATEQVDSRGQPVRTVIVLPHLDLLTTSQGGLTGEAREVIVLLYENPTIVFLGFKDPSFQVPKVIENLFPHRVSLLGIARDRLRHLVTQKESRKFGRQFNPWGLYKYVSGVNAARLRKLLSTLEGEDYPADPRQAYRQLRQATLTGSLEIPELHLDTDIGGYEKVKKRLRTEILDVLSRRDAATTEEEVSRLEDLIPRGMIFWGPPGTGKTFFAKAMASAIGAAITVVSGPELKSKWVGESEENLRQIFYKARQSAPSIIVFDEIDSFATARGTYTGSGVEHSMVNQLLTEMDGFHKEELVFIVGTTNFVESLDPALLRPGRFEFHLHIPYPEADDRREILKIYDKKMRLEMTDAAIDFAVRRTADFVIGAAAGTRYTGDHLNALCRAIARLRLRDGITGPTEADLVELALTEWVERPKMTPQELNVLATHEAGHAVVSLHCPHAPAIERITIASEMHWAFGYVRHADPHHKYIQTVNYYLDMICVALGAREAEKVFLSDLSLGATGDLQSATLIARELVEVHGYGAPDVVQYRKMDHEGNRQPDLSPKVLEELDDRVRAIVEEQRQRAEKIIAENKAMVATLRDLLLEHKTIDAKVLTELAPEKTAKKANKKD
ncbi:MAG TPA: AAA family ATPase [Gemmataceae bacterium]|nr:AAA family ATPase [Gemmataceae bacterium]